jgi:hypothetical protein
VHSDDDRSIVVQGEDPLRFDGEVFPLQRPVKKRVDQAFQTTVGTPARNLGRLDERSLGEVKRRTKVIGRFPGETSCLTLVWAVLELYITNATNGINFTQLEHQQLKRVRYEGDEQTEAEEVTAA